MPYECFICDADISSIDDIAWCKKCVAELQEELRVGNKLMAQITDRCRDLEHLLSGIRDLMGVDETGKCGFCQHVSIHAAWCPLGDIVRLLEGQR